MLINEIVKFNEPKTLRIGKYDAEWASSMTQSIDKQLDQGIHPQILNLKPSDVYATQEWIDNDFGGGDPVFPSLKLPVIAKIKNEYYIVDGHHRFHNASKNNMPVKSYVFSLDWK